MSYQESLNNIKDGLDNYLVIYAEDVKKIQELINKFAELTKYDSILFLNEKGECVKRWKKKPQRKN